MRKRHIAIAGYGTAGQALALLLSRDGHAVEVFERAPRLGPVGCRCCGSWDCWMPRWRMGGGCAGSTGKRHVAAR